MPIAGLAVALALGLAASPPPSSPAPFDQSATTVDELLDLGRPVVLAHTGGEDRYPGSTMYAFHNSVAAGVDMLDLNVTLSADDVVVVHHDLTVERTTNGTGTVAEMTFDELHALDNAYWFTPECSACTGAPDAAYVLRGVRTGDVPAPAGFTADDFAIPALADVVGAFPDIPLNIEIKGSGELALATADALVAELTALDRRDGTVVIVVRRRRRRPRRRHLRPTSRSHPAWRAPPPSSSTARRLPDGQRILQLPPMFDDTEVLTPDVVAAAHAAGYVIWVWPNDRALENADGYADLLARGVDGLNVNDPQVGVASVEAFVAGAAPATTAG